jgi:hypothetical protein
MLFGQYSIPNLGNIFSSVRFKYASWCFFACLLLCKFFITNVCEHFSMLSCVPFRVSCIYLLEWVLVFHFMNATYVPVGVFWCSISCMLFGQSIINDLVRPFNVLSCLPFCKK